MEMDTNILSSLLAESFDESKIFVEENGGHYHITIVSEKFSGMKSVGRQQLVYNVLAEQITGGAIHAVVIKTYTYEEWIENN